MNGDKYDDSTACATCKRHARIGFPHACSRPFDQSCRHCPWPGCNCTHGGGCDKGWIEGEPLRAGYEPAFFRCPNCADAAKDAAMLIAAGK